ncbi:hypothetical protein L1077_23195 [Pseudoalteromonas luteoviolacea]|uniref:DUF7415 domain-containing protein n=1 Tax=Pseudoalteromonas luteoviolacea TaxID=43657 RepID=UPI001F2A2FE6|nr:hypothetical protein [Pseudoalteromonas luteoviolacea]MCF6442337.1 hypothetical protein [Pseudoalteromonas luteoviolacea]
MKVLDWNELAELGLLAKINKEILHPLGLAAVRDSTTGQSAGALVSDDGVWEYDPKVELPEFDEKKIKGYIANI